MSRRDLKIVAGTLTVVGVVMAVLEHIFAPDYLVFGKSPLDTPWFIWPKLVITSLAPIAYIVIDVIENRRGNKPNKEKLQDQIE